MKLKNKAQDVPPVGRKRFDWKREHRAGRKPILGPRTRFNYFLPDELRKRANKTFERWNKLKIKPFMTLAIASREGLQSYLTWLETQMTRAQKGNFHVKPKRREWQ